MALQVHRTIGAPPQAVAALLSDFSRLHEYNPNVRAVGARAGPARPGDRFELRVRSGPLRLRVRCEVLAADEHGVTLAARSLVGATERRFAEPAPGGCLVGWEVSYRVPWWLGGRVADALVFRPLARRQIEAELDGVARLLGAG